MELEPYVDEIRRQLTIAADTDEAGRVVAERLLATLDTAARLAVQHALADAADEITCDLAPGSVELRVRGRELAFVVTAPPLDASADGRLADDSGAVARGAPADGEGGELVRINVRMPESLKTRIEEAAGAQRVSINAWLVRAASLALEQPVASERRSSGDARRYRGWAR